MFRAFTSLVMLTVAVSVGAVLGSRSVQPRPRSAISPGLLEPVIIGLCCLGALLTLRQGVHWPIAIAIWVGMALLAGFEIHRWRNSRKDRKQLKSSPGLGLPEYIRAGNELETSSPGVLARWRSFAVEVGGFQSRLILHAFYFSVFALFGLTVGRFGDLLKVRAKPNDPSWQPRRSASPAIEDSRRQS